MQKNVLTQSSNIRNVMGGENYVFFLTFSHLHFAFRVLQVNWKTLSPNL